MATNGQNFDKEQEIKALKDSLCRILGSLSRVPTEKEIKTAFKDQEGYNINVALEKIDVTLIHFLRFHCKSFCDVYRLDGNVKILRLFEPSSQVGQNKKHKKHQKNIPKLHVNVGKVDARNPQSKIPLNKSKSVANLSEKVDDELSQYIYNRKSKTSLETDVSPDKVNKTTLSVNSSSEFPCLKKESEETVLSEILNEGNNKKSDLETTNDFNFENLDKSLTEIQREVAEEKQIDESRRFETADDSMDCRFSNGSGNQQAASDFQLEYFMKIRYPEIIDDPKVSIPTPKLKIITDRILFEIRITMAYSPTQFWFQYGEETLFIHMKSLNEFYGRLPVGHLVIDKSNVRINLVVATKFHDTWQRARILSEVNDENNVQVFLVDIGCTCWKSLSNIRYLLKMFSMYPMKALKGALSGIRPRNGENFWSEEFSRHFCSHVFDKKLFGAIKSLRHDGVFLLEITEKITKRENLSQEMIHKDLADPATVDNYFPYAYPLPFAAINFCI
ncbi:CLUMA_CG017760, isoform A [Clunio marinus]|uniref:CLUMA_CG017760, isoform A n=1 Tax=Clunio marinus TaxID=568069 RepID=A0A1J1IX66_9DIPT|nr:CLUMA_CG017760, isoform A [Clunio marinus]